MKWLLYDALFALVFPFLLPGFLLRMIRRGGYAARMGDRFALYPPDVVAQFNPDGQPACPHTSRPSNPSPSSFVWIHAVSVGEVQVAGQLMRAWRQVEPGVRFCFSTTSSTGWKMAEKEVEKAGGDVLIYNPLDFPSFVKSALKLVRPRAIVLTESEIWPVFIRRAKRYGVPLFLINARVSDRSAPRYRFARFFFKDVFGAFTRIFAQSELDRERLVAAGAPAERVEVTGSFKFDVARRNPAKERELREWILGESRSRATKILLGGSTWPGEDVALLKIYGKLLDAERSRGRSSPKGPLLVLAPRHFEKADQVEANIRAAGFECIRRSRGERAGDERRETGTETERRETGTETERRETEKETERRETEKAEVYLCDTTGEMMGLFGICDVAFVGKSLCAHGSQNMIEPCLCGKPTVVGPYTENFRPVMSDLLAANAIVQIKDEGMGGLDAGCAFRRNAPTGGSDAGCAFRRNAPTGGSDAGCAFRRNAPTGGSRSCATALEDSLEREILRLMTDDAAARELGARAAAAVLRRQGVVPRCVSEIRESLAGHGSSAPHGRKERSE